MYKYNKDLKIVQGLHNCKKCIHLPVCVFHVKMDELAHTNIMFKMNEYLESNNILKVLEEHTSCRYYTLKYFESNNGGKCINLECDPEIINYIISNDVKLIQKNVLEGIKDENKVVITDDRFFFFQPEVKIDIKNNNYHLILKTTNKDIGHGKIVFESDIVISDILKDWHFGYVS